MTASRVFDKPADRSGRALEGCNGSKHVDLVGHTVHRLGQRVCVGRSVYMLGRCSVRRDIVGQLVYASRLVGVGARGRRARVDQGYRQGESSRADPRCEMRTASGSGRTTGRQPIQ